MTQIFATEPSCARAKLVFSGDRFVSLPRISEILQALLGNAGPVSIEDVTLTSLLLGTEDRSVYLDLAFEGKETVLTLGLRMLDDAEHSAAAALARMLYYLAQNLPISDVIWNEDGPRIPRDLFVSSLEDCFPTGKSAQISSITPRRINPVVRRARDSDFVAQEKGAPTVERLYTSDLPSLRSGDVRLDAHVDAYEAHMRDVFRAAQDEPEPEEKVSLFASWAAVLSGSGNTKQPAWHR